MKFNLSAYGVTFKMLYQDLVRLAGRLLDKAQMIRFDEASGTLHATDLSRTASHYYIKYDTIEMANI